MRLLAETPHVAALVAHHALTAYARYDGEPEWRDFFRTMASERDSRVAALATRATGVTFDSFLRDYASLRAADLISLALCHGWQDRFELDYYRGVPDGTTLTLTPDPFDGAVVSWRVAARRVPRRRYLSDTDLRDAFAVGTRRVAERARRRPAGATPVMSRILVVEDDPDIAELLRHLPRTRQSRGGGPDPADRTPSPGCARAGRPRHPRPHAPGRGRPRDLPADSGDPGPGGPPAS